MRKINPPVAAKGNIFFVLALCLLAMSVFLRAVYYALSYGGVWDTFTVVVSVIMPIVLGVGFVVAALVAPHKPLYTVCCVAIGCLFFALKTRDFDHEWHKVLCILLYTAVGCLYAFTAFGILNPLLFVRLVFGLPFAFHLGQDFYMAFSGVRISGFESWLPELSVLFIIGGLFAYTLALQPKQTR